MTRFFGATVLGKRLHVSGISPSGPWESKRIELFPEEQIVIVPGTGDRLIHTIEDLEAIIVALPGVAPTRRVWILEDLEDEARRLWEAGG